MTQPRLKTTGQQFGCRSRAEPWKIKVVEPIRSTLIRGFVAWSGALSAPGGIPTRVTIAIQPWS
jgi:hypothetical protein